MGNSYRDLILDHRTATSSTGRSAIAIAESTWGFGEDSNAGHHLRIRMGLQLILLETPISTWESNPHRLSVKALDETRPWKRPSRAGDQDTLRWTSLQLSAICLATTAAGYQRQLQFSSSISPIPPGGGFGGCWQRRRATIQKKVRLPIPLNPLSACICWFV